MDLEGAVEGQFLVKIICGKNAEEVERKAAEFEKTHIISNVIQKTETLMFLFYLE